MAAPTIFKDLSLNSSKGQYAISPPEFSQIETTLDESKKRYTYNARDGALRFTEPTWIHSSSSIWITDWVLDMEHHGMVMPRSLMPYLSDLHGFADPFAGSKINPSSGICPVTRSWPTFVLKIGYAETEDDLISDADLILQGSEGRTGYVIVVSLKELQAGDQGIQEGYVELYKYDKETEKRVRVGERQQLYPILPDHASQSIDFSWYDILRNRSDLCTTQEKPLPLYLDNLRTALTEGVKPHLFFKNGGMEYRQSLADDDAELI